MVERAVIRVGGIQAPHEDFRGPNGTRRSVLDPVQAGDIWDPIPRKRVRETLSVSARNRFDLLVSNWRREWADEHGDHDSCVTYGQCADALEELLEDYDV